MIDSPTRLGTAMEMHSATKWFVEEKPTDSGTVFVKPAELLGQENNWFGAEERPTDGGTTFRKPEQPTDGGGGEDKEDGKGGK